MAFHLREFFKCLTVEGSLDSAKDLGADGIVLLIWNLEVKEFIMTTRRIYCKEVKVKRFTFN